MFELFLVGCFKKVVRIGSSLLSRSIIELNGKDQPVAFLCGLGKTHCDF